MLEQLRHLFSGHLLNLDHVTLPTLDLKSHCHVVKHLQLKSKVTDAAQSKGQSK